MDLITGWDFTIYRHRRAAVEHVRKVKPKLIIGSPECTMFSTLQNPSKNMRKEGFEEKVKEAIGHVKFVTELYAMQIKEGRWLLHEHPAGASSWGLEEIKKIERETGVRIRTADQCMYGLKTWGRDKTKKDKYARKKV